MNPFNYQQPEPTWMKLQRQYSQPAALQVTMPPVAPLARIPPGVFLAGVGTALALAVIFDKKSSKDTKAVAYQILSVAAPIVLGNIFSIQ
jgi:hypothetical protein